MLQTLREKSSGWIAAVILGLLCIPFAFFGMEQYLFQRNATWAAKIEAPPTWWPSAPSFWPVSMLWDSEEIGADEFRTTFEQARQQQRQAQGPLFDPQAFEATDNKRRILENMIDRRVMRMAATREGMAVGDAQVRETIESIPAFQVGGRFDQQSYLLALQSQGQTPTQFQEIVRNDLVQAVVPTGIADSAFVTKSEVDRMLKLLGETRGVRYAVIPPPAADTTPVTAADIESWYRRNAASFRAPESVTIEVLDVEASKLPPPAAPDETALRERYAQEQAKFGSGEQRLVSHILIKEGPGAEKKAADLAAKAKAPGADFAALARGNSEDAGSKASGGDLGAIQKNGAMVKPFEDAVFAMQAGEVRGPVKTDFGYHVIQVREVRASQQQPFEEVRDTLVAEQAEADRERAFNELLGKLVDEVNENPTTLSAAAELAKIPLRTLGPLTRAPRPGDTDPVASNPAVLRAAFAERAIQDGEVSEPIEIAPGHSVMLRVKSHQPERALPLAQVRERVIDAIHRDRAAKAASAAADAALAQLRQGKALSELASERGWDYSDVPTLLRGQPVPDPKANEAIFAAPAPAAGRATFGKAARDDGGAVLFAVDKVVPGKPEDAAPQQRVGLQSQLAEIAGSEDALALVRGLRKAMKIEVAEDRL